MSRTPIETWSSMGLLLASEGVSDFDASRAELGLDVPGLANIARALAKPAERVGFDVREAPAYEVTRVVLAVLHDVIPACPTDLACVELAHRVAPEDVPGIDAGIVNPQRRAVEHAWQDPHVLNGSSFEHPAEMDLADPLVLRSIVGVDDGIHLPSPDQPAIEAELGDAVGSWTGAVQR